MRIDRHTLGRVVCCALAGLALSFASAQETPHDTAGVMESGRWRFGFYLDGGHTASSTDPANGLWRSKSTTFELDSLEVNLAAAGVSKRARQESRWGFSFALQTGVDTDDLVASDHAYSQANRLRYLHRANASYWFGSGREHRLTFGLINSYIGYESYLALDNPNYTRGYLLDVVPYFLIGAEYSRRVADDVLVRLYLVTGYDYLAHPNQVPSTGVQVTWRATSRLFLRQNLYYGPDQTSSSIDYWRFLSDSLMQWKSDRWLVAAAFDYVTEKQADVAGLPRYSWTSAAVWARWDVTARLSLALRPELLDDADGLATGYRQRIAAVAATLKYDLKPQEYNRIQLALELRRDRSTGPDGGYYDGSDNALVEYQNLVLFGATWKFQRVHRVHEGRRRKRAKRGA
jgi:hypothetical protein